MLTSALVLLVGYVYVELFFNSYEFISTDSYLDDRYRVLNADVRSYPLKVSKFEGIE